MQRTGPAKIVGHMARERARVTRYTRPKSALRPPSFLLWPCAPFSYVFLLLLAGQLRGGSDYDGSAVCAFKSIRPTAAQ